MSGGVFCVRKLTTCHAPITSGPIFCGYEGKQVNAELNQKEEAICLNSVTYRREKLVIIGIWK
jgi:hypothetical protein